MKARILGPLEVVVEGQHIEIPGGKQRELLAILLIHANEIVSADTLIDGLWGETPPPSALKTLQALVSGCGDAGLGRWSARDAWPRLPTPSRERRARLPTCSVTRSRRHGAHEPTASPSAPPSSCDRRSRLWRGPALAEFRYADFAQAGDRATRRAPPRGPGGADRGRARARAPRRARRRAGGARRRASAARTAAGSADARPATARDGRQRRCRPTRRGAARSPRSSASSRARACGDSSGGSSTRTRRSLAPSPCEAASRRAPSWRQPRTIVAVGRARCSPSRSERPSTRAARGDAHELQGAACVALDPQSGDATASVPLGTAPSAVSVGEGSVWVLDADDRTVSQIDPETRAVVRTFSTSSTPTDLAAAPGSLDRHHDVGRRRRPEQRVPRRPRVRPSRRDGRAPARADRRSGEHVRRGAADSTSPSRRMPSG